MPAQIFAYIYMAWNEVIMNKFIEIIVIVCL
jgi:hypothetical protein